MVTPMAEQTTMTRRGAAGESGSDRAEPSPPGDALLKLVSVEIPRELKRIQKMDSPSVASLQAELHGTVGSLVGTLGAYLLEIRNWSSQMHGIQADHIEALDVRVDSLEEFGGETQILPADAELFSKVISACEYLAGELLKGPIPERDEEGKAKLAEIVSLCGDAQRVVDESTLAFDPDFEAGDLSDVAPQEEPN